MKVAVAKVNDYQPKNVQAGVEAALESLGGLGCFIQAGDKVLLKPNMLEGLPSERAVTTHPEVVRAMIRQVKRLGATPVIGDSPGVAGTLKTAEKCGILAICREENVQLIAFENSAEYQFPEGKTLKKFRLSEVLQQVDKVVSVAKMKTHTFMGMTGATKNLFGCIVGVQKAQFHLRTRQRREFAGMLIDLALLVKPVLSVVDGIVGMEGNGPRNGRLVQPGLILAGENCFAVDIVMAEIMGLEINSLPVAALSLELGLTPPCSAIERVGDGREVRHRFVAPRSMQSLEDRVPAWFARWAANHLTARPEICPNCILCGRCVAHCPPQAMKIAGGKVRIDDAKCIRCYCCQELCPENAVRLQTGLVLDLANKFMK